MCGFVALWDRQGRREPDVLRRTIKQLTQTITHRGPDAHGTHCIDARGVALGHRRLAILDTSEHGHQPMASPTGRYWLAYNGETYNFEALRAALQEDTGPQSWRGHSDTEVLLACFEAWGVLETMKRTHGMCAFACYDTREDALWLVRDRLGQKPLYWTHDRGEIRAASEIRALRAHSDHTDVIHQDTLLRYLYTGVVEQPASILEGIEQVAPGSALRFGRDGDPSVHPWWTLAPRTDRPENRESALKEADRVLTRAVSQRTASDVPIGALLSGGIDSTLMVALLAKRGARPLKTFTIAVDHAEHDESAHARKIAEYLGTEHTELRLTGEDMLAAAPNMAKVYDEPFADASQIPTWMVCKLTREHVTVAISGDGGDELFGGYERYRRIAKRWRRLRSFPAGLRRLGASPLAYLGTSTLPHGRLGNIGRQLGARNLMEHYRQATSISPNPGYFLRDAPRLGPEATSAHRHEVAQMMRCDLGRYLLSDILVKTDRASMSVGLELRAPMLDHDVVELALSLPTEWTWSEAQGKQVLRHVLSKHVPPALWERPKQGFSVPLTRWVRGPLADWMEEALSPEGLAESGVWDTPRVRAFWRAHQEGRHSHTSGLWAIAQFESWRRGDLYTS